MTNTNIRDLLVIGAVIIATLAAMLILQSGEQKAFAAAPSGLAATVYSTGTFTVSNTAMQIAATTTQCAARDVSTGASAVMLGFTAAAGTTTSGTVGMWQAGSTTVAYDSGIYGCGQVSAYSYTSGIVNVITTK